MPAVPAGVAAVGHRVVFAVRAESAGHVPDPPIGGAGSGGAVARRSVALMNHAPRPSAFERRPFVEELEHMRAEAAHGARARRFGCVGVLVVVCAVLAVTVWR